MDARKIAHDLRTPLAALQLAITGAMAAKAPEDLRRFLDMANRSGKAIGDIVESMAQVAATGKAELSIRMCVPLDLVANAIGQFAPIAEQRRIRVERGSLAGLPVVPADETRIVRVIVNLLSNAVRFSPDGGRILVDARKRVNDGHAVVVFSVSDEGPGVPPADIDRIFVEGVSLGKPSTGLGLAVCKELVEAHGGRIWVEARRDTGATFSFSVPLEADPGPRPGGSMRQEA